MAGRVSTWLSDLFLKNPIAWLLLAAFLIAEHGNYKKGKLVDELCELTGAHDVAMSHPRTDRERIDSICIERQADD